jgi:hypothetical protein
MDKREKVIKGLQAIINDDWMWKNAGYCAGICKDALALLKAQEPRVLSWDEVYANNRPFVVWHESRYGDEAEPLAFVDGEYVNSECTLYIEMNFANQRDYMADRDDGFRFWTAEPSFEQMEATPWE